jgi:hypothetical protein
VTAVVSSAVERQWFRTLLSGHPHQVVESADGPYLYRWYLLPRNRWHNVYLHKFVRSDDPGALHDHPWGFVSLVIAGGYREFTQQAVLQRRRGSLAWRGATHRHRIELLRDEQGCERPCLTVVVTGSRRRPWGFWCGGAHRQQRFIAWQDFGHGGCGEPDATTIPR